MIPQLLKNNTQQRTLSTEKFSWKFCQTVYEQTLNDKRDDDSEVLNSAINPESQFSNLAEDDETRNQQMKMGFMVDYRVG